MTRNESILEQAKAAHASALKRGAIRVWECEYAHDRRAHRHRCCVCRKILETGQRVVMFRDTARTTKAFHAEHSSTMLWEGATYDYMDWALARAYEHLVR